MQLNECAMRVWRSPKGAAAVEEAKKDTVAVLKALEAELGG
jgi:glutathione S-transferase